MIYDPSQIYLGAQAKAGTLTAARFRKSKTLQHAFHTSALPYFCWHSSILADGARIYRKVDAEVVLTIEPIHLRDLPAFMVPPQQSNLVRIPSAHQLLSPP